MKSSAFLFLRSLFLAITASFFLLPAAEAAGGADRFDILYLKSKSLDTILDYKANLNTVFNSKISRKIRVMGQGEEYALVYDGNDSKRSVARILVSHGAMLQEAGFNEPLGVKDQLFRPLYNVSYGIGPNLEPLKKRYSRIYRQLGEDVRDNLVIERTDWGNYVLVYQFRGAKGAAAQIASKHKRLLRSKRISTSVTPENANEVVYGESSLINDAGELLAEKVKTQAVRRKVLEARQNVVAGSSGKQIISRAHKAVKYRRKVEDRRSIAAKNKGLRKKSKKNRRGRLAKTNSGLEKSIEQHIDSLRRKGRIRGDEATGWMVYDLKQDLSVVDINANKSFQAASMIKPFVALAFFHKVQRGQLRYGKKSRRKLALMIQRSDNAATNWVMKQVGGPVACDTLLRRNYRGILKNTRIREYIPAGGRTYRNTAAPADYVRFLKSLWDNNLPYSKEIRRLMALPGRDRIYNGTPIPRGTLVYNKTGSTAHLVGDMGILVPRTENGARYPYIVVGVIERRSRPSNYGGWMDSRGNIIREVSTLVYRELKKDHHLR